eukprot:CAMPEP_0185169214 /NCGR_PEP_ID=MMETSP1139-20130426/16979_1 /TAXON_ID=298111 /ORGANISM="Pavlova sp., Strain CCMP459" /LENGTH=98 /DNA_ID=CAMNT_0027734741 /DNA_START=196 /DNA_END=492 /DNA_ORIENTATION=+
MRYTTGSRVCLSHPCDQIQCCGKGVAPAAGNKSDAHGAIGRGRSKVHAVHAFPRESLLRRHAPSASVDYHNLAVPAPRSSRANANAPTLCVAAETTRV